MPRLTVHSPCPCVLTIGLTLTSLLVWGNSYTALSRTQVTDCPRSLGGGGLILFVCCYCCDSVTSVLDCIHPVEWLMKYLVKYTAPVVVLRKFNLAYCKFFQCQAENQISDERRGKSTAAVRSQTGVESPNHSSPTALVLSYSPSDIVCSDAPPLPLPCLYPASPLLSSSPSSPRWAD